MDVWGQIWPNPYPEGKVHRATVMGLRRHLTLWTTFEKIIAMVSLQDIGDDSDVIATARALRDIRDEWRKSYNPYRWAITA